MDTSNLYGDFQNSEILKEKNSNALEWSRMLPVDTCFIFGIKTMLGVFKDIINY